MKYFLLILLLCVSCKKTAGPPEKSYPVRVDKVVEQDVPLQIETIGNVTAPRTVQIRPQVTGKLEKAYIPEGSFVKEGDLMFNIEPYPFQAALDSANATLKRDEANLSYSKATLERFEKLINKDYISKQNYDQYVRDVAVGEALVMQDKAQVEIAKINLGYAYIHAPWDGRLGNFNINEGNIVGPNDSIPLTDLRQVRPIEVNFTITQEQFQRLKQHQEQNPYTVFAYLPGQVAGFKGTVDFLDNRVDTVTGTILLKGIFPNENLELWPGEFATVRLIVETIPNATLVPTSSVQIGQEGHYVYIVNGDRVELRLVEVGDVYRELILIKKGVKPGETVVTDGQINLKPDAKVTIYEPKETGVKG